MSALSAFIKIVAKKLGIDLLTNPEKGLKLVLLIFVGLFCFLLLLLMPVFLIISLPSLVWDGITDGLLPKEQYDIYKIYKDAAEITYQEAVNWKENQVNNYSYADDIVVNFDFDLSWNELVAIDAVRLEQDYKKANMNDVKSIAHKFMYTNTSTVTYTVYEEVTDPITKITTRVPVEKTRAVITVKKVPIEEVLASLNYSDEEKDIVRFMIDNTSEFQVKGVVE